MLKKAIKELEETLKIMKKYEDHIPPTPEAGCFYATFNDSIVYICRIDYDGEARALIIRGGYGSSECGEIYWLSEEGYHRDENAGPHLVMALREKLDIKLPSFD